MNKLTVAMLITATRENLPVTTLCFDTLRVGFPNADIIVFQNGAVGSFLTDHLEAKCSATNAILHEIDSTIHHAEWIKRCIHTCSDRLIIIDGDTIFWDNCEDFYFDAPMAGMYVPRMWNEFAQCVSAGRLHTSFLWFRSAQEVRDKIRNAYLWNQREHGEYCPFDPFRPFVSFRDGTPVFNDTCSQLYQAIGGARFTRNELERFDHVNSASFYDAMCQRVTNKEAFQRIHELARTDPKKLRGLYLEVQNYYKQHRV